MQDNSRYNRVETRFPRGSREAKDLVDLAKRLKGNPEKTSAALQQMVIFWSRCKNGEISIQTFCELVGIPLPPQGVPGMPAQMPFPPVQHPYPMYPSMGGYPPSGQTGPIPVMTPSGMMPQASPLPGSYDMQQEDPAEVERKKRERERRSRNRNAAASEYTE